MAYEQLEEARRGLENVLARMLQSKKQSDRGDIPELATEASILFLKLRQVNREILQEEDRVKSETEAAKSPLDHTTLQLNNLLYEKNHYLKAIKTCKDFKSKFPDIELVPEEQFFADAPEEMQSDPAIKTDAHKLMLQRLNFEMLQRKNLCKQRELLEARKKMLQENITNRKKFLSSLPSHLKSLKKASLPVQLHLGMLHTRRTKQYQLADILPAPLYVLYTQLVSHLEAFGELIEVEITGSAKEAQALLKQQGKSEEGVPADVDEDEDDDDSQRRRKRARKTLDKQSSREAGVFQPHPLSVILQMYDDEEVDPAKRLKLLTLRFEYLHKLNVVSVGMESEDDQISSLTNLFPDDTGLDLPNQATKLTAESKIPDDSKRRWFRWAQHLAGLDFLSEQPQENGISAGLAIYRKQHRVQTVLQQLRCRKKSQMALKEQLDSLQQLVIPEIKFNKIPWASHVAKCQFKAWAQKRTDTQSQSIVFGVQDSEAGREDGELPPSAGLKENAPKKPTRRSNIDTSQHALDVDLNRSAIDDDDPMEYEQIDEPSVAPELNNSKMNKESWKDHGCQYYVAVIRREDQVSSRVFELEATVKLAIDYPGRPPLCQLRLISGNVGMTHPQVPAGVVDAIEEPLQGEEQVQWFNQLRAMEAKVNIEVLQSLPKWEEDYVLTHQIAQLRCLFDTEIDSELSLLVGGDGIRSHRGRERRIVSST